MGGKLQFVILRVHDVFGPGQVGLTDASCVRALCARARACACVRERLYA